jgi:hypothetical protein
MNEETTETEQVQRSYPSSVVAYEQPLAIRHDPNLRFLSVRRVVSILRKLSEVVGCKRALTNQQITYLKEGLPRGAVELKEPISVDSVASLLRAKMIERCSQSLLVGEMMRPKPTGILAVCSGKKGLFVEDGHGALRICPGIVAHSAFDTSVQHNITSFGFPWMSCAGGT